MDDMSLVTVLFLSIPEEFLITVLGFLLFGIGIRKRFRQLLLIATLQAVTSFFVRLLPLPFGIHTLVQIPLFAVAVWLVLGLPYLVSFTCILVSLTIYVVLDASFVTLLLKITHISMESVLKSTVLRELFFLPQGLTMLFVIFVIYFTGFKLFDLAHYSLTRSKN